MKRDRRALFLVVAATTLALSLGACSDDDETVNNPPSDTTAPLVVSVSPTNGSTQVGLSTAIVIEFNEAMDPATAAGNVTLSSGGITGTTWSDPKTLTVSHGAWAEGIQVTVTVGTGLTDAAGNALAQAFSASFFTESSTLTFLTSIPADGAAGVARNASIQLLFSRTMNLGSLAGAVTISDVASGKTDYPFLVVEGEGDWVIIDPTSDLPATTTFYVTVSTDAQDSQGGNLPAEVSFDFTTGADIDVTPPTIVGIEPASGSTIPASTAFFRITFSEPMDPTSLNPSQISVQTYLAVVASGAEPYWTDNNTRFVVPLGTPLPAGVQFTVGFADFRDANGVVQPAETVWTATIAGTPDPYPVVDGQRFVFNVAYESGPSGGAPDDLSDYFEYEQIEVQGNGTFRRAWYETEAYAVVGGWDVLRKTASALQLLGFFEENEGDPQTIVFDSPVTWLPLPPGSATWTAQTTVELDGDTVTIVGHGQVVEQADLPFATAKHGKQSPEAFWSDSWHVRLDITISIGEETIQVTGEDFWYAPGYGLVLYSTYEEDFTEDRWREETGGVVLEDFD